MTRAISAENQAALGGRRLVARDFIWLIAKSRVDGSPVEDGAWSGVGTIDAEVIDPKTGGTQTRTFYGAGSLISIGDIPLVQGIAVQNVTITLSQVNEHVNNFVRTYDLKQAEIQIFRGLFDPETRQMVAPAAPRFSGFIDSAPITTPKENEDGSVELTCTSNAQELNRANSATRSDASQRLRSSTDNFFQDVSVVKDWQIFWGKASGTAVGGNVFDGKGGFGS